MKFIVGVGNPGKKYDGTRHNIGFAVADLLRERKHCQGFAELIKPDTFVNATGEEIARIEDKLGNPSDLLIVCDDVNLAFGKLRLRAEGSAGGHHGLESVIAALGSEAFPRLRFGVGSENMPKGDISNFVLGKFDADERKEVSTILEKAVQVCEAWAREGYAEAEKRLSQLQSKK